MTPSFRDAVNAAYLNQHAAVITFRYLWEARLCEDPLARVRLALALVRASDEYGAALEQCIHRIPRPPRPVQVCIHCDHEYCAGADDPFGVVKIPLSALRHP